MYRVLFDFGRVCCFVFHSALGVRAVSSSIRLQLFLHVSLLKVSLKTNQVFENNWLGSRWDHFVFFVRILEQGLVGGGVGN